MATPRYPPSPPRSEDRRVDREYDVRGLDHHPLLGTPTRAAFGFGFGGLNHNKMIPDPNTPGPSTANNRVTTLLPPPTIIEPGQSQEDAEAQETVPDLKRSSQIVFHSGFINRLADVPSNFNHANLPLSKGWKPFKLELKGSKLYFYKPPGDRATSIKDLFPTGLVPPSEQDDDISVDATLSEDPLRKPRAREDSNSGTIGRKKRAFWGRRTHPDLIRDASGRIEKGTFEALIHEAVFATTFSLLPPTPVGVDNEIDNTEASVQRLTQWHEFAASILFSIPFVVGRQIFEVEFLRCCSYLVSGADDSDRNHEKSRVVWLANEYLRYYGHAIDIPAWNEWKQETIASAELTAEAPTLPSCMIASSSTQAIFHPSPALGSVVASPEVNTFSPRPEEAGKTTSLLEALFPSAAHMHSEIRGYDKQQSPRLGLVPPANRFPWAALREEGLTRDVLLYLDPFLVAKSLTLFHRSVLEQCPDNLTVEFIIVTPEDSSDANDHGFSPPPPSVLPASSSLFGSDDQPHWLTKLILLQILGGDTSSGHINNYTNGQPTSPGRRSEDRGGIHTSRTHSRSELISIWARVGELCRLAGDETSWRAIFAALCSRPVARLDKAWKRVNLQALSVIEAWAHFINSADPSAGVAQPRMTPWGGDVKDRVNQELVQARTEKEAGDPMVRMDGVASARRLFDAFRTAFSLCPRKTQVSENEVGDDMRRMVGFWRDMAAEGGGTSGMAIKFQRSIFFPFSFCNFFFY